MRLPAEIADKILALPESSMGANRVALVLRDGSVIEDVKVAWGNDVVSIGGRNEFSLPVCEIVDVIDRGR